VSPNANKVRSADLAKELDITVDTLDRWARTDEDLGACRWRRGWWDVMKLRAAGFLQVKAVARA